MDYGAVGCSAGKKPLAIKKGKLGKQSKGMAAAEAFMKGLSGK